MTLRLLDSILHPCSTISNVSGAATAKLMATNVIAATTMATTSITILSTTDLHPAVDTITDFTAATTSATADGTETMHVRGAQPEQGTSMYLHTWLGPFHS
jgi:2',3'-cyclic-nucleotide 2'-phosphodiesterase (5'-nucleotidase family)